MDIRDRIMELRRCFPSEIDDHPYQWKEHTQQQREVVSALLREVGMADALLVWPSERNGHRLTAFDGHLRKSLDQTLAWPTLVTDLTDDEADLMLTMVDPITALVTTNRERFDGALRQAKTGESAVAQFLSELAAKEGLYQGNGGGVLEDVEPQIDKAAELQEQWQTELGQLWEITSLTMPGKAHRLLCGDSTLCEDVIRLMNREPAALIVTDPPYGQAYLSNRYGPNHSTPNPQGKIMNDDRPHPEMLSAWVELLSPSGALYVCTRWAQCEDWYSWIDNRLRIRNIIVWKKNNWSAGDLEGAYGFMYEQVIFASQDGHKLRGHRLPDVWEFDRVAPDLHPTTKPVGLFSQAIEKSSDRYNLIADPFVGSGTTLVCAEQLGRLAYGCEIDERWVAVTLQRLQDMGLTPCLVEP